MLVVLHDRAKIGDFLRSENGILDATGRSRHCNPAMDSTNCTIQDIN